MRKAAGFLIVLFLATLVVITTSSGDETNSSHVVHLDDPYGPQITTCGDCHPVPSECADVGDPYPCCTGVDTGCNWSGMYTDFADFNNTTQCDTCHSPDGAYDGVDSTSGSVGAKDNWSTAPFPFDNNSSLVYDSSGEFQAGKEKWCVGCHDENPAHSMLGFATDQDCIDDPGCALAPNIAGDDTEYGYYKTGHGKFGSECLACHDSAVDHVDGVARTYKAASLNYQVGYRLKLVGGLAPLEVPRSSSISVGIFRQCFSCHDSAPFMDSLNTDTNFRADKTDSCLVLTPPENQHNYHLDNAMADGWDSDWDGAGDSFMSCTGCHNVHGPRLLRVGTSNAPAMIRTGELIGRGNSLNLDYFINACSESPIIPDDLSGTNETVDSTGGVMFDYGTGNGTIARNGVCDMCHTEAQPYWRAAKTLPPAPGTNDFSGDGNAVALWSLEEASGNDRVDSIGSNDLSENGTTIARSTNQQEETYSADFESSTSESLTRTDANLDSGFPFKNGDTNKIISVTGWFRLDSFATFRVIYGKWEGADGKRVFAISVDGTSGEGDFTVRIGYNSGASAESIYSGNTIELGKWYHFGVTYEDSTKDWQVVLYEEGTGEIVNTSGTATNNINIEDAGLSLGNFFTGSGYFDGLMDEVVVFDDILTTTEIDQIRQGTYSAPTPTTTTTTLPGGTTTTTTLPGGTTTTTTLPGGTTTTTTLP
ncbi:LamG domain-containing protein, partial [Thermodesulfobacteriota bacterium]